MAQEINTLFDRLREQEVFTIDWDVKPSGHRLYLNGNDYLLYLLLGSDRERKNLAWLYKFDTVILPFVKRMMFLFGALGMVDLGYGPPSNTIHRQYGKPFPTPFDGLHYVRLTDLGSYVAGKKFCQLISGI